MSLILDALNRADQERSKEDHVLGATTIQQEPATASYPIKRWIIELLIIITIGVFFYFQTEENVSREVNVAELPVSKQPVDKGEVENSHSKSAMAPAIASSVTTITKPEANSNSANANKIPNSKLVSNTIVKAKSQETNKLIPKKELKISPAISSLYQHQAEIEQARKTTTPVTVDNSPADNTLTILNSMPLLSELSIGFQRNIPTIEYTVHVYAENGGFVVLNGKQFKVGGLVHSRLRVIAILKGSLVLDFQGNQFRLVALNSWMNFN